MPKIKVDKPFFLNLPDGTVTPRFGVGVHTVSDEVAQHWFTKHHAKVLKVEDDAEPVAHAFKNIEGTGSPVPDDLKGVQDAPKTKSAEDQEADESDDDGEELEPDDEDAELEASAEEAEPEAPVTRKGRGR
jgi:hypothetical protein